MKSVLVLGADGYLGWPTCMYFSKRGYEVIAVDSYYKLKILKKYNIKQLFKLPSLQDKAKIWYKLTGREIKVKICDLKNIHELKNLFTKKTKFEWSISKNFKIPDTAIHFAEQPSAPYSLLKNETANDTLLNNLIVTNNLLFAIKNFNPKCHLVKLGTMGEYGTPNIDIEEGWLDITHNKRKDKFLFPRQASSIYHTSKIMDTDLIWFAVRNWKLKATDLMQGPVYGIHTEESKLSKKLMTAFNYDEMFGTVLNRFLIQGMINYPLTVYGNGSQTRGYINISDTLKCINLSVKNPSKKGELQIFNQITETFSVNDLAFKVKDAFKEFGINVKIKKINNPRNEASNHYYNPKYQSLKKLGFKPKLLTKEILVEIINELMNYKNKIIKKQIFNGIKW